MKRIITLSVLITANMPLFAGQDSPTNTRFVKEVGKNLVATVVFPYAPYTTLAAVAAHEWYKHSQAPVAQNGGGDGQSGSGNGGGSVGGWRK